MNIRTGPSGPSHTNQKQSGPAEPLPYTALPVHPVAGAELVHATHTAHHRHSGGIGRQQNAKDTAVTLQPHLPPAGAIVVPDRGCRTGSCTPLSCRPARCILPEAGGQGVTGQASCSVSCCLLLFHYAFTAATRVPPEPNLDNTPIPYTPFLK